MHVLCVLQIVMEGVKRDANCHRGNVYANGHVELAAIVAVAFHRALPVTMIPVLAMPT